MWRKVPVLFIVYLGIWAALCGSFDPFRLAVGAFFSIFAALFSAHFMPVRMIRYAHPVRIMWFIAYFFMIMGDLIRAAVLNGLYLFMPVLPGTPHRISLKTTIVSGPGRLLLSNALNLAAETMCIDCADDGTLSMYASTPAGRDAKTTVTALVRRYENVIGKVCD